MAIVFDACTVPKPCRTIGTSRRAAVATVTGTVGGCDVACGAGSGQRRNATAAAATATAMTAARKNLCEDRRLGFSAIAFILALLSSAEARCFWQILAPQILSSP